MRKRKRNLFHPFYFKLDDYDIIIGKTKQNLKTFNNWNWQKQYILMVVVDVSICMQVDEEKKKLSKKHLHYLIRRIEK